ncbi:HAD-IA family hydrolase [Kitasatospora sp. NPDC096077]|uniref:HAD family hydrolase n=1 Tax=Kitasatospora sp. NPDC096077 TaxID=3155544 RepID=UPI003316A1AA
MPIPIELVIFDCDGVLLDSERVAVKVDARVAAAIGWPLSEAEIVERFVGRTHAYMTAELAARASVPLEPGWERAYQHLYDEAFAAELAPVEGVVEALAELERAGVRDCVASSSGHSRLRDTLGRTGLLARFEGRIFSAEDVAAGKPAPDLFLHAAAVAGVEPAACLVVEDSKYGVAAARAAGMRSLGFHGGLTPAAWLAGPGTRTFDDMRELPALVAGAAALPLP